MAIVRDHHADMLAGDPHMRRVQWFRAVTGSSAHAAHKRSGGGATASASARRLGLKNYYTLTIPWEPDPKKRTKWHPTDRTGPFKTLQRGAFPTTAAAHAWAKKHLGPGATYSIHRH